jgi:hypothetical protein
LAGPKRSHREQEGFNAVILERTRVDFGRQTVALVASLGQEYRMRFLNALVGAFS